MQSIGFESITDALHVKLKDKHRNETAFWKQFEESYWNGPRKCWLSSCLGPGFPRTNNPLERHNLHVKSTLTFHQLLPTNEFLSSLQVWFTKESERHKNLHATSPMEHARGKTNERAISRIRHVWREGQSHDYHFYPKTSNWYVFKSGHSRQNLEHVDAVQLHADYSKINPTASFDEQIRMVQYLCEIYLHNDKWICSCPHHKQHGTCKHLISFKLNVLSHAVPEKYDITTLCTRKKRGRPKKASSKCTIDVPETINLLDDDEDDNDDLEVGKICGMAT